MRPEDVHVVRHWAMRHSILEDEALTRATHPANGTSWVTDHEGVIGNIGKHDACGTNECPTPDHHTSHDRGIRTECSAAPNPRSQELIAAANGGAGPTNVREHTTRANEHVVI